MLATLSVAVSSCALADGYAFLNVGHSGGESAFELNRIERITFDAGFMVVSLTGGAEQRLELSGLQKMFFSATGSQGIDDAGAGDDKIGIGGGELRLRLEAGEKAYIYNMKGEVVHTANRSGVFRLDNLQKGVYIVRLGSVTKKVLTK